METKSIWAFLIGIGVGIFILVGGAYVLKRTFSLMDSPTNKDENTSRGVNRSFGQAMGLASLWTSKIIVACGVLYFCQKAGFSTQWLGLGIPVGIGLGYLVLPSKDP